jgi:RNA polymerase sigma factor for flagellar operon FliA
MNLTQWHRALNEIQSVGIDGGSRVLSAGPTSMQQPADPELLIDGSENAFDLCYHRENLDILGRALSCLPERERQVISLHSEGLTMNQIAQLMHVDESRVSQIHSGALVRLKASVNSLLRPRQGGALESGTRSMTAGAGG